MRHPCLAVLLALPLALAVSPVRAESCGWMSAAELDRLLPAAAPWSLMTGGRIGACKFMGRGRNNTGATILGANQMLKADAAEAAGMARELRGQLTASYRVEPQPELGEHGFRYLPEATDQTGERRSVSYIGHYRHVVVTGQLALAPGMPFDESAAGATAFMRAALAVADDAEATSAATRCPYFDEAILRRLLPGKDYSQQVFGANSCLAQDGAGATLMLSIMDPVEPGVAERMRDAGCTWEAPAGAPPGVLLGHSCQGGNPRAQLEFTLDGKTLRYTFVPGSEPTPAQRALMLDLARAVHAGAR